MKIHYNEETKTFGILADKVKKLMPRNPDISQRAFKIYNSINDNWDKYRKEAFDKFNEYKLNRTPDEIESDKRIVDSTLNKYDGNIKLDPNKPSHQKAGVVSINPNQDIWINHEIEHDKRYRENPKRLKLDSTVFGEDPGYYSFNNRDTLMRYPIDVIQDEKRANRGQVMNTYLNDKNATEADLERMHKLARISQDSYEKRMGFDNSPNLEWNTDSETVKKIRENRGFSNTNKSKKQKSKSWNKVMDKYKNNLKYKWRLKDDGTWEVDESKPSTKGIHL